MIWLYFILLTFILCSVIIAGSFVFVGKKIGQVKVQLIVRATDTTSIRVDRADRVEASGACIEGSSNVFANSTFNAPDLTIEHAEKHSHVCDQDRKDAV